MRIQLQKDYGSNEITFLNPKNKMTQELEISKFSIQLYQENGSGDQKKKILVYKKLFQNQSMDRRRLNNNIESKFESWWWSDLRKVCEKVKK